MSTSPLDDANEADIAEQQRPATYRDDDDAPPSRPTVSSDEANEADALEQSAEVGEDDDDYDR